MCTVTLRYTKTPSGLSETADNSVLLISGVDSWYKFHCNIDLITAIVGVNTPLHVAIQRQTGVSSSGVARPGDLVGHKHGKWSLAA